MSNQHKRWIKTFIAIILMVLMILDIHELISHTLYSIMFTTLIVLAMFLPTYPESKKKQDPTQDDEP